MKLILFLGSGVSKASGLPLTGELTEAMLGSSQLALRGDSITRRVHEDAVRERIQRLLKIMIDLDTRDAKRNAVFRGPTSYEDLFYLCEEMAQWLIRLVDNSIVTPYMKALERRARPLLASGDLETRLTDLARLARDARLFIQSVTTAALRGGAPAGLDLIVELARSERVEQLNIVTLNHDTLVERLLEDQQIEMTDGFGPADGDVRWRDDRVYDGDSSPSVRLFKLHGSVTWSPFTVHGVTRTASVRQDDGRDLFDGQRNLLERWVPSTSFLTGGNKAIRYQHGIYIDLQFRFQELLRQCDVILMCGYGWADLAVNLRLDTWLDDSRKRIVLLHPNPEDITSRSMIVASGYSSWVSSGRLIPVKRWMSELSLADLEKDLFGPT